MVGVALAQEEVEIANLLLELLVLGRVDELLLQRQELGDFHGSRMGCRNCWRSITAHTSALTPRRPKRWCAKPAEHGFGRSGRSGRR